MSTTPNICGRTSPTPHPEPRAARVEGYLRRSEPSYSLCRARGRAGVGAHAEGNLPSSSTEGCCGKRPLFHQEDEKDEGCLTARYPSTRPHGRLRMRGRMTPRGRLTMRGVGKAPLHDK
jgi:hypothetical protein